jgi:hypothetical protein
MTTFAKATAAIRAAGIDGEVCRGVGYFYFIGPAFDLVPETGVYGSAPLRDWSDEAVVAEARRKIEDANK